jgi:sulfonate dioxygenase
MAPSDSLRELSIRNTADTADTADTVEKTLKPRFTPGESVVQPPPENYEYEHLKPNFPSLFYPPLEEVPYQDKGLLGDPEYKNLLANAVDCFDYHPKIGTEVVGVKLKNLTDEQKNDLGIYRDPLPGNTTDTLTARLIAFRGVVIFRDQLDFTVEDQLALGRYFGVLHKHATTAVPKQPGLEEIHVVYADEDSVDQRALFTPFHLWHSDVTLPFHRS